MLTVRDWLHPRNGAVIEGTEYDCVGRFDFDRRGGGMVVLRYAGLSPADPLDCAFTVDLDDLAELERVGLVLPANSVVTQDAKPMSRMPTVVWLKSQVAEGRLALI